MNDIRVSDEQRERVAQDLREHFAAGRLTDEELSERVQAAYRARTEQELRALEADLPGLPAPPEQLKAELAQRRRHLQRRLLQQSGGALAPFAICTAVWAAAGADSPFWPVWVLIVAVIPLVRNAWRLYGPAPELDRVEAELAMRESVRRAARSGAAQTRLDARSERGRARRGRRR